MVGLVCVWGGGGWEEGGEGQTRGAGRAGVVWPVRAQASVTWEQPGTTSQPPAAGLE